MFFPGRLQSTFSVPPESVSRMNRINQRHHHHQVPGFSFTSSIIRRQALPQVDTDQSATLPPLQSSLYLQQVKSWILVRPAAGFMFLLS